MAASMNTMATAGTQRNIDELKPLPDQYVPHYLLPASVRSSSSTIKGPENSESSKSSSRDNLLELLENDFCGELPDDILTPEYLPVSCFPKVNYRKQKSVRE